MCHRRGVVSIANMKCFLALLVVLGLPVYAADTNLASPAQLNQATTNSLTGGILIPELPPVPLQAPKVKNVEILFGPLEAQAA